MGEARLQGQGHYAMTPETFRPAVAISGDRILVFVGAAYQPMSLEAAETLYAKLGAAIEQAKQQTADQA
ncbi:hypothetical protein L2Y96_18205 [Luteibacter aegosomaticola]|uniref:hypothetical protein n=1 Tax=Luteibacter aegosomaticola TaxID=2911538 RepID=UPI001FFA0EC8|nr:hypothetical protein [Luteibacter aegosomaticola]UPG89312.1 hypothetical protein L2Y96_18205 [Luteibacter aegosomaticola]